MKLKVSKNIFSLTLIILFLSGCSGNIKLYKNEKANFPKDFTFFIVENETSTKIPTYVIPVVLPVASGAFISYGEEEKIPSNEETAMFIKMALKKHDIDSTIGSEYEIPNDVNIVVKYKDIWKRVGVLYLSDYYIQFYDLNNGKYLVGAWFHVDDSLAYPTTKSETPKMIDALFGK